MNSTWQSNIQHKYKAKNGLGGYVVTNQPFHLDFSGISGTVLLIRFHAWTHNSRRINMNIVFRSLFR